MVVSTTRDRTKAIELVGREKIAKKQEKLSELREVDKISNLFFSRDDLVEKSRQTPASLMISALLFEYIFSVVVAVVDPR